jgi:hypothetical protein
MSVRFASAEHPRSTQTWQQAREARDAHFGEVSTTVSRLIGQAFYLGLFGSAQVSKALFRLVVVRNGAACRVLISMFLHLITGMVRRSVGVGAVA